MKNAENGQRPRVQPIASLPGRQRRRLARLPPETACQPEDKERERTETGSEEGGDGQLAPTKHRRSDKENNTEGRDAGGGVGEDNVLPVSEAGHCTVDEQNGHVVDRDAVQHHERRRPDLLVHEEQRRDEPGRQLDIERRRAAVFVHGARRLMSARSVSIAEPVQDAAGRVDDDKDHHDERNEERLGRQLRNGRHVWNGAGLVQQFEHVQLEAEKDGDDGPGNELQLGVGDCVYGLDVQRPGGFPGCPLSLNPAAR